ncbi:MAG: 4-(cytidine 5'-diphospho)-2-C-methyl-D-erythritol kinase [Lachnospiraceae bacterium]|nr:4-(cytidine 5'-diphospho)-2-C-methyl-D-erythritol kinase [Lachnospiraceae bacterium]
MEERIELEAHAKINLALDVIGERPNGYHDVKMIMQSIKLCDRVTIERTEGDGVSLTGNLSWLPCGKGNLAYDAAVLFMERTGIRAGVSIYLEKHIPVAAGLAGGSTDAAAVLKGLNELFETGLSEEALCEMGLSLGADVPYCIMGGTALAEGIGEQLTKLPNAPVFHVVLIKPEASASTKEIYGRLVLDGKTDHPDVNGMIRAIEEGDYLGISSRLGNVLEPVTRELCPEIVKIEQAMKSFGAEGTLMSGSGPSVFGLFTDSARATAAFMHFRVAGYRQAFLTEFTE